MTDPAPSPVPAADPSAPGHAGPPGPLSGMRVLDLSRILAGPTCTQILGDLGADVIKIERPGVGDDTRHWGPPFLKDAAGNDTREAGYYLCANRSKRSVAVDFGDPRGQQVIHRLLAKSDILVENYKLGGLDKYGLSYPAVKAAHPGLIYCSITGFGHTGPYAARPGYDFLMQAMGGLMSITGEGRPVKMGVAIADLLTGLYATIAILSAVHHRHQTGRGQHVDMALLDVAVASLANQATNYLVGGVVPEPIGNAHPNIVPYQPFPASDGLVIVAVGNDGQFRRLAGLLGRPEWADDPRYATNPARVANRDTLIPEIAAITRTNTQAHWLAKLEAHGVSGAPVNTVDQVFADPQVLARQMKVRLPHPVAAGGAVDLPGSPFKLSETPGRPRSAPPTLGQHTAEVLAEVAGLSTAEIADLAAAGVIGGP